MFVFIQREEIHGYRWDEVVVLPASRFYMRDKRCLCIQKVLCRDDRKANRFVPYVNKAVDQIFSEMYGR